ncbi:hypothetical protein [uncultured Prevotella sp.]|uniref:hypothetical protein n=1 Tax=uncultured Prevotella sp. TaxID=159272 RepID=UPI0027E3A845|nr:hypothetical protein [uncultured Prevotella sp.]
MWAIILYHQDCHCYKKTQYDVRSNDSLGHAAIYVLCPRLRSYATDNMRNTSGKQNILTEERIDLIKKRLDEWCGKKGYKHANGMASWRNRKEIDSTCGQSQPALLPISLFPTSI